MSGFELLLTHLADPSSDRDDLRQRWEDDPWTTGSAEPYNLDERQIGIIIRGFVREIQAELKKLGSTKKARPYIQVI